MQESISLIILGLVQGLTEFLPVSSTGHLILVREFLGVSTGGVGLAEDAVLHLATAFAVLVYFRKDILLLIHGAFQALQQRTWNKEMTLMSALVVGTVPVVLFGLWLKDSIETILRGSVVVALGLIAGSVVFVAAEYMHKKIFEKEHITLQKGFVVGLFQALALIPGMSRSGMTISGGMLLGLSRVEAARFAFLLSFPVILGAGTLKLLELLNSGTTLASSAPLALGALAAFFSGMLAIHTLISFLKTNTLMPFVVYRLALAGVILLLV